MGIQFIHNWRNVLNIRIVSIDQSLNLTRSIDSRALIGDSISMPILQWFKKNKLLTPLLSGGMQYSFRSQGLMAFVKTFGSFLDRTLFAKSNTIIWSANNFRPSDIEDHTLRPNSTISLKFVTGKTVSGSFIALHRVPIA